MSELAELAKFIVDLRPEEIPEDVKKAAVLHVLDTVGTAVGAASDRQIQSVLREWTKKDKGGSVHIWGTGKQSGLSTSVFMNAMMAHTQEMDDVHTKSKTHIGTVVIPAAWGTAEYLGAGGKEFLLAVICGYEVMSRIGMAFGVSAHRNQGWHVTATAGTFGAAAAAGKLLGLDQENMVWALGLAGAQSFGTWAFLSDGATCKAVNPARAAQDGVEAALLARAGVSGPEHVLTSQDGGLFHMMTDQAVPALAVQDLGKKWQILDMDSKPYPSCRSTHCVIDGVLKLREKYQLSATDIDHIQIHTYSVGYKQCGAAPGSREPKTVVNAKFSSPFVAACAIVRGEVTLREMKEEIIQDPEIQDLLHKVQVEPDPAFTEAYPEHWGCRVQIYTKDGEVREALVPDASGSTARPLTEKQVKDKAVSLMEETVKELAEEYAGRILKIQEAPCMPAL